MINLDKILEDSIKEKKSILAELTPLRAEEKKLAEQLAPIDEKLRAVREKCADIEKKRDLAGASRAIVALSKAGPGSKTLKAETGQFKKE